MTRIAGNGTVANPLPGPATKSPLVDPISVGVDAHGSVLVLDQYSQEVVRISPTGVLSVVTTHVSALQIAVGSAGDVYTTSGPQVIKISPLGHRTTIAGNGSAGDPVAGPALSSPLSAPWGVAVDHLGNVFVSDSTGSHSIVKVTPTGSLSILGNMPPEPGGGSVIASLGAGPSGTVLMADPNRQKVLQMSATGAVTYLAGNGWDKMVRPGPALSSGMTPFGVTVDLHGNILVANAVSALMKLTPVLPQITMTGSPTIVGTYAVGHTLSAHLGTFSPSGVSVAYQWFENGHTITGAHYSTLRLTSGLRGTLISVRVTGSKSGYRSYTHTTIGKRVL